MRTPYIIVALATACVAGTTFYSTQFKADPRVLPASAVDPTNDYSNILPDDYVGTQSCAQCHREQHDHWQRHPHSCMNQLPNEKSVLADFDNATMTLPAGDVNFTTDGERYWMTVCLANARDGSENANTAKQETVFRKYYVTRTVGSRYMQYFIGKQIVGPEPAGDDIYAEHMLPFAYSLRTFRWYPRQYFDADGDEHLAQGIPQVEALNGEPSVRSYTQTCMNCHNTMPYAYRIFEDKLVGFPDATVAAAVKPLSAALAHEGVQVKPTAADFNALNRRLDPDSDLISMGIGCESCHLGGREHAKRERAIKFLPENKYIQLKANSDVHKLTNSRENAATIIGICTQCHSGGTKKFPNGASKSNSAEAIDHHDGFCTTQLRCVDCHEPHTAGQLSGGPDLIDHVAICTKCHQQYEDPVKAIAHSGHPAAAGVNCLDCHMPKITQGLANIIRTHRITHPVEEVMLKSGSANACNTCHLDKSTRWTIAELNKGWGVNFQATPAWPIYSELDTPVGELWINGDDNHLRLLATQSYARSPLGKQPAAIESVIRSLNDPEPLNRLFAGFAVRKIFGLEQPAKLPVDITQSPAARKEQIQTLLKEVDRASKDLNPVSL
jgi:hypothetical protein